MNINTINLNIKDALIAHNNRSKNLWRSIKATAANIAKEQKIEVSDTICGRAVKIELKQLEQTLASVPEDSALAAETRESIAELNAYLPKQLTDEDLKREILGIVMAMPKEASFGLRMKECMSKLSEVADGKRISKILKSLN